MTDPTDPPPPGEHGPHADFEACEARLLDALNRNMALRQEIDDLSRQKAGLESMLCDAQEEIADLTTRLMRAYVALRPFAEAARDGSDVALSEVPLEHFRRAADLIPEQDT